MTASEGFRVRMTGSEEAQNDRKERGSLKMTRSKGLRTTFSRF